MTGRVVAHYRVGRKLGEGGMGVVYQAEDTKHGRTVALKFLSARLLDNPDAKKRFFREAKAAAALHHPNICTIYEIAEHEDETFLAMAYLDGETLEDRITRGPLPLRDALEICRQLADGLEAAHAKGVIHRDIKPSNILVSSDGRATILDFGLARLAETSRLTKTAVAVGTVAYMSPEQARGDDVDHRTDVWSLGCVLYEAVAGHKPFRGAYDQAVLYEISCEEPEPLTSRRADVPMELEFIATKCLAKEPASRYQQAREIAVDLRNLQDRLKSGRSTILRVAPPAVQRATRQHREYLWPGLLALAVLVLAIVAFAYSRRQTTDSPVIEFTLTPPAELATAEITLSPNGRYIVVSTLPARSLWLRSLDSLEWRELPGSKGARYPFWSPDSTRIAFFAEQQLRTISVAGGPPETIAHAADGRGGSWGADGTILFAPAAYGRIQFVDSSGGDVQALGDPTGGREPARRFPYILPGGRSYLFSEDKDAAPEDSGVFLGSLDGEPPRRLLADSTNAVYVPRPTQPGMGSLLFVREGALMAQPFNLTRLELSGGAIALGAAPAAGENAGFFLFSASSNGLLAHSAPSASELSSRRLVWRDRQGQTIEQLPLVSAYFSTPRLSPDGRKIVYSARDGSNDDIWVYDLERGARTRLTSDPRGDSDPVWSPDGSEVVYRSDRDRGKLYLRSSYGSADVVALNGAGANVYPNDWSADGRYLLYRAQAPETRVDLWYFERTGDSWESKLYLGSPAIEVFARLSPDIRYVAYVSEESGRREVYVQPFPGGGRKTTVSHTGGGGPAWSRDGKELFYVAADDTLIAVPVSTRGDFSIGEGVRLFQQPELAGRTTGTTNYEVSPDGRRFLVVDTENLDASPEEPIHIVVNWPARITGAP